MYAATKSERLPAHQLGQSADDRYNIVQTKRLMVKYMMTQNRERAHHNHAGEEKTGRLQCHPDETRKENPDSVCLRVTTSKRKPGDFGCCTQNRTNIQQSIDSAGSHNFDEFSREMALAVEVGGPNLARNMTKREKIEHLESTTSKRKPGDFGC
jgi:translation initiation factor IF-2